MFSVLLHTAPLSRFLDIRSWRSVARMRIIHMYSLHCFVKMNVLVASTNRRRITSLLSSLSTRALAKVNGAVSISRTTRSGTCTHSETAILLFSKVHTLISLVAARSLASCHSYTGVMSSIMMRYSMIINNSFVNLFAIRFSQSERLS